MPARLRGQLGMTLLEVILVVAIAGVLASMAVTNFARQKAKAHQAEAKIALATIYHLEKAFYSEYNAYIPSFTAIGYSPEGLKRYYTTGWTCGSGPHVFSMNITGYSGAKTGCAYGDVNDPIQGGGSVCALGNAPLNMPLVDAAPYDVDDPQTFEVGATGWIRTGGGCDQWKIDHLKQLQNVRIGY